MVIRNCLNLPGAMAGRFCACSRFSSPMSACSASRCELTETYLPTATDIAPATSLATPATKMATLGAEEAATPIVMRLAVETMASSDPSTARAQPPCTHAAVDFHLARKHDRSSLQVGHKFSSTDGWAWRSWNGCRSSLRDIPAATQRFDQLGARRQLFHLEV